MHWFCQVWEHVLLDQHVVLVRNEETGNAVDTPFLRIQGWDKGAVVHEGAYPESKPDPSFGNTQNA